VAMEPKSPQFKAAERAVRAEIQAAKKRGTSGGDIGYYGCISVMNDFLVILENASQAADQGDYAFAYFVAGLIQINLAKLASRADDSAGSITDTRRYVERLLDKVCSGVEYGSSEAEYILLRSLTDSKNSAFDGWAEFSTDILQRTARLTTEKNRQKVYSTLDELRAREGKKSFSNWFNEECLVVECEVIRATGSESEVEEFINENLRYDGIRKIAIRNAVSKEQFDQAEALCLEKIESLILDKRGSYGGDYYWTWEWYGLLNDVYAAAGDAKKQTELVEELLLSKKDARYYGTLKSLLMQNGTWEDKREVLLNQMTYALSYEDFQAILVDENETRRLMDSVMQNPDSVFNHGKKLAKEFPDEVFEACLVSIRSQAARVDNRKGYRRVCRLIRKLSDFGGKAEARAVVYELIAAYPKRPAFLDELYGVSSKV